MTHLARLGWLVLSFTFTTSLLAAPTETVQWGWRPPVELAGEGEPEAAVRQLRHYIQLQRLVMERTDYHDQTRAFVDDLWESLESFDLEGFYQLLPEQQAPWRALTVYGEVGPDQYHIGPEPRLRPGSDQPGLGDFRAEVRAREIDAEDATHYLLDANVGIGLGNVGWPSVVRAAEEALRMVGGQETGQVTPRLTDLEGTLARDSGGELEVYRRQARGLNPALSEAELDLLAPVWASYPQMWQLVSGLGTLDDLLIVDEGEPGYRQVHGVFTLHPQRLANAYPDLARYLERLDSLVKAELNLYDEYGRLIRVGVDSERLQGTLSMVVRDGQVVPVRYEKPVAEAPRFDPREPRQLRAHVDARLDVLGIIAEVEGMSFEIAYEPTAQGARFVAQGRSVPRVGVGGRALGVLPASIIDVVLPKRIDQLMRDFLTVACEGNSQQGITGIVEVGGGAGEPGQLQLAAAFEGLDNFFVRIGMGIINNRVIPGERVSEDLKNLVNDAHQAFSSDLDQFERLLVQR
ncbi:hypothetical protein [Marinobacter zhejiangensis]|uniref:Uncharacterized protein n=1 Tax=Marinobacter zhejiangensis TaxID=488535 RepID=A0A1I4Q7Z8_9GAMM|nr:hypothetical protein [Marinobacter zhejiangensis]SFM36174.1 hypothetical protein SAMN04487963_2235 [Marinobacter zhejiangensis]